jgi:hypothetical protein
MIGIVAVYTLSLPPLEERQRGNGSRVTGGTGPARRQAFGMVLRGHRLGARRVSPRAAD